MAGSAKLGSSADTAAELYRQGHFSAAAASFEAQARGDSPDLALRSWSNAAAAHMQLRDLDAAIAACTRGLSVELVDTSRENIILQTKCRLRRAQCLLSVAESRGLQCAEAAADEAAFCQGTATEQSGDIIKRAQQVYSSAQAMLRRNGPPLGNKIAASAEAGLKEYSAGPGELLTAAHSLRLQCRADERYDEIPLYLTVTCANEFGLFSETLFESRLSEAGCDASHQHAVALQPVCWRGMPAELWQGLCSTGSPRRLSGAHSPLAAADWERASLQVQADTVGAALHGAVKPCPAACLDKHGRAFLAVGTAVQHGSLAGVWLVPVCIHMRLAAGGDVAAPVLSPPLAWCPGTGQLKGIPPACMQQLLESHGVAVQAAAAASAACSRVFQLTLQSPETDSAAQQPPQSVDIVLSEHYGELGIAGRNWDAGIATACLLARLASQAALLPASGHITRHMVIELGAGTGLTGITLASVWRAVTSMGRTLSPLSLFLTDVPAAVPAMEFNLLLNELTATPAQNTSAVSTVSAGVSSSAALVSAQSAALFWGVDSVDSVLSPGKDQGASGSSPSLQSGLRWNTLVLMTDVVYDEEVYAGLAAACRDACGVSGVPGGLQAAEGGMQGDTPSPDCISPLLHTVFEGLRGLTRGDGGASLPEADSAMGSLIRGSALAQGKGALPWMLLGYRPRHESAVDWWDEILQSFHAVRVWHAASGGCRQGGGQTAADASSGDASPPSLPHSLVLDLPWVCGEMSRDTAGAPGSAWGLLLPHWCEMIVTRGSDLSLFALFPRL